MMADSSPSQRRPQSSSPNETGSSSGQLPSRVSGPPSEPRPSARGSFGHLDVSADRPARLQLIVALLLGLVLIAIPLYLWRRPRAESIATGGSVDAGIDPAVGAAPSTTSAQAEDAKPTLSPIRSILCQDPGQKKTAPEQCDRVDELEKAFGKAIEDSASCVPREAGGGTIQYVADVSFKRKAIHVAAPKDGRTMKSTKVVSTCLAKVKSKLQALPLEPLPHAHARYKISVTASYPGVVK
jgi:hypothetical protein